MDANTYQAEAKRTLIDVPDREIPRHDLALVYDVVSIAIEVGKLVEHLKKGIFHQHGIDHKMLDERLSAIAEMALDSSPPIPNLSEQEVMKLWVLSGLIGEAAEIGENILTELETGEKWVEMGKELGDCQWYLASIATQYNIALNDVLLGNIEKLLGPNGRYKQGYYSSEASKNRQE